MDSRIKIMDSNQNIVNFYRSFYIIITLLFFFFIRKTTTTGRTTLSIPQGFVFLGEKPTISVVGEAERKISPDETKVSLAVENTEANANLARKNNAKKIDKITTVSNNGLTNENISTSNFGIRPNYDIANNNFEKIVSYTALNKIILTTSSNANISSFIDFAVNSGANRVDSIEYTSSKKILNENFKELLKDAFTDSIQKVEILYNEDNFLIN